MREDAHGAGRGCDSVAEELDLLRRQDNFVLVALGPDALVGVVLEVAVRAMVVVGVEGDETEAAHVEGVIVAWQGECAQNLIEGVGALKLVVAHDVVCGQRRGGVFGDHAARGGDVVAEVAAVDDELGLGTDGAVEDGV